jgi:hypothetical protein
MKFKLFLLGLTFFHWQAFGQVNFEWVRALNGSTNNYGYSVQTDIEGNIYTMGTYSGTADFDPGPSVFNLTSNGLQNTFIQKMTSDGAFLWALSIPMIGNEMVLDLDGHIYTTGRFSGTVDLDPGPGVFNATATNGQHGLIHKIDLNGNFEWAKSFGGTGTVNSCYDIKVDNVGNIYTTGRFEGTTDFDPGNSVFNLSSIGQIDIFVHKMDGNGNFLWAKTFGSSGLDYGYSTTVDDVGNVYTVGTFTNTVDFDPDSGITNLTSLSSNNVFIQKLNQNGSFIWAKSFAANLVNSIEFDELGSIYIIGNFTNTVDFDPGIGVSNLSSAGGTNAFIQKLDLNGNFLWAKSFGGTNVTTPKCLDFDLNGNFYIAGSFGGTADFDPSTNSFTQISSGSNDIFFSKFDALGTFVWAITLGGTFIDYANSISINSIGEFYLTGVFSNSVDFNPDNASTILTTGGNHDVFVLKFNQCLPTSSFDNQFSCSPYTWLNGQTYSTDNNSATYVIPNSQGCDSTTTLNLTILPLPSVAVASSSGVLTANQQNATYQWLDCDNNYNPISGATLISFTPQISGNYAVEINQNSCIDTSQCYAVTVNSSGLGEHLISNDRLFPNPNNGSFYFESYKGGNYLITDAVGKVINSFFTEKSIKKLITITNLPNGVYLIVPEGSNSLPMKLVIE